MMSFFRNVLIGLITGAIALSTCTSAFAAAPDLKVRSDHFPSFIQPEGTVKFEVPVGNVGDAPTTGPVTVRIELPPELTTDGAHVADEAGVWTCDVSPDGHVISCALPEEGIFGSIEADQEACNFFYCRIFLEAAVAPGAVGGAVVVTVCEGGVHCAYDRDPIRIGPFGDFRLVNWDGDWTVDDEGNAFTQAGGHPYAVVNDFELSRHLTDDDIVVPDGTLRNALAQLPAGFIGAPNSMPSCASTEDLVPAGTASETPRCPLNSIVGTISVRSATDGGVRLGIPGKVVPIFNMKPPPGIPAQFGFNIDGFAAFLNAKLRADGDYGVNIVSNNIVEALPLTGVTTTFWGVPADPSHDFQRCAVYATHISFPVYEGFCEGEPGTLRGPNAATVGTVKAFLTNPTKCTPPETGAEIPLRVDSWEKPMRSDDFSFITHTTGDPNTWKPIGNDGCDVVPFDPNISMQPSTDQADTPTGLEVTISVPKEGINNPDGIAQSSLKDATVKLPEGMTLNPSYGDGVSTCSTEQIGLTSGDASEVHFDLEPQHCPDAAQIGSVHIETPLLDFPLDGGMYLAEQSNPARPGIENPFNGLLAVYMVASEPLHGVQVKLAGEIKRDPITGQVITVFKDNPQIAFSKLVVKFKGGQRAPLATPSNCGTYTVVGEFTPYARPNRARIVTDAMQITKGPDGNPASCVSKPEDRPFHPTFIAGTENNTAGSFSPFAIRMLRADGEQEITTFSADFPPGLVAKLAGIPKCPDAAIEAAKRKSGLEEKLNPSCSAASQVGQTLVGAGTGSILTYSPGKVYLAGPYKGAPLSVVTITPATVGPFDLDTVVVRSAFKVDPETALVHIDSRASDPIPHIFQGIALHIREIRVLVNRPNFTINPTNCDPMAFTAHLTGTGATFGNSADDVGVDLSAPYEAADCQALPFKPKLTFELKGGTRRGQFPAFQALLKARPGDANIAGSTVVLPRSEFIEQGHIRTVCTRVQFNANQCPPGSVYGHAKAITPLFDEPLEGPVYLRSNGGERLLPDLVASLDGEIEVALAGYVDSIQGKVRNRFEVVPDAPVTKFELKMQGGKKGLLVNHLNLCQVTSRATVKLVGQNGKLLETRPKMGTSCKKRAGAKRSQKR